MPDGPRRPLQVRRLGLVEYGAALTLQAELVAQRRDGLIPDQLLLLEHPHVITQGVSSLPEHVLIGAEQRERMGIALHDVGRGGDVTYHGPGQLVGYPILDLKPDRKDLHRYLRDLESTLIRALARLGVVGGGRREGLTGVWLPTGKVAAIGVRVSSGWISSHGFALNVAPDLDFFSTIVPCGIADEAVTSLARLLDPCPSLDLVGDSVVAEFASVFERRVEASV